DGWNGLGNVYSYIENNEKAIDCYLKAIEHKEKADFIPEVTKEEKKIWMTTDNLKKQFLSYFIEVEQRYHSYLFWQEKYGPATVQEFDWGTEQNNAHFSIFFFFSGIGPELNMGHGHNTSGLRCLGSGRLEDFIRLDQKSREEIGRLARKFEDQDLEVGYIACTFLYPEESKKATPEDYPLHMKSDIFYQLISQKENWPEEKTGEKAREKTFAWARQNPDQLISFRKEKLETAKNLMESFQSLVSDYLDLLKVF
ncbi:tetratricopeptide repeat protein, partial [Candidatus Woesearchaeota archaeon]|nr:tetratricopeptide repeat protein [Candidatus Woesearchaeota archaeon]